MTRPAGAMPTDVADVPLIHMARLLLQDLELLEIKALMRQTKEAMEREKGIVKAIAKERAKIA